MTDATAAFQNVKRSNVRDPAPGNRRRAARVLSRGLCIGIGLILATGILATTVTVAAAWIVRSTLNNSAHLQARGAFAVATANSRDRSAGGTRSEAAARPPQPVITAVALNAVIFDTSAAVATASTFVPRVTAAPKPAETSSLRRLAPSLLDAPGSDLPRDLAYAPDAIRVAALISVALPAAAPDEWMPGRETAATASLPLPRRPPARQRSARGSSRVVVASLTTGSIPDAGNLRERNDGPPPQPHARRRVAVYDISASTVYMPNGERLEAHSGLGHRRDDPRHVRVKNQGPTPPNIYDLTMRERLFHGVRAVRLNPVDEAKMYGRDGMLAHTYLLGPSGQSNGCVSFKDYSKFLRAFLRGEVDRLVVVPRLGDVSWLTVAARGRAGRRYADLSL